jgi:hypothetical protein
LLLVALTLEILFLGLTAAAFSLKEVAQRAYGARAGGSNRNEQDGIDLIGLQQAGEMLGVAAPPHRGERRP